MVAEPILNTLEMNYQAVKEAIQRNEADLGSACVGFETLLACVRYVFQRPPPHGVTVDDPVTRYGYEISYWRGVANELRSSLNEKSETTGEEESKQGQGERG
jgi:hypothetical protein